ncbi:MAG: hypothetical protein ABII80_03305 [bacterium]
MSFRERDTLIDRTKVETHIGLDGVVESENIGEHICATVKRAIETAPQLKVDPNNPRSSGEMRQALFEESDGRGLIKFRAPSDLYLMPLIEKEIYKQMMDRLIIEGKGVNARALMCVDPELGKFVEEKFPESNLYGETMLEHEARHVIGFGDYERMGEVSLRMVKHIYPTGKEVLTIEDVSVAGVMGRKGDKLFSQLAGIFAPKHPSIDDIEVARQLINELAPEELDEVEKQQLSAIEEYMETIIDDGERDDVIFEEWMQYSNLERYFHNGDC